MRSNLFLFAFVLVVTVHSAQVTHYAVRETSTRAIPNVNGTWWCFINALAAMDPSSLCSVELVNDETWMLSARGSTPSFLCGASCVAGIRVSERTAVVFSNETSPGPLREVPIDQFSSSVAALSRVAALGANGAVCQANDDDGTDAEVSSLNDYSTNPNFECGAQAINLTALPWTLADASPQLFDNTSGVLVSADTNVTIANGFCFLVVAAQIGSTESCFMSVVNGKWFLNAQSEQSSFDCGAFCLSEFSCDSPCGLGGYCSRGQCVFDDPVCDMGGSPFDHLCQYSCDCGDDLGTCIDSSTCIPASDLVDMTSGATLKHSFSVVFVTALALIAKSLLL